MSTKVSIAKFLKGQHESHWQLVTRAREEQKRLGEEVQRTNRKRAGVAEEITKKKTLITQNTAEGVDASTLVKKVEDLEREDAGLVAELQSLQTRVEAAQPEPP